MNCSCLPQCDSVDYAIVSRLLKSLFRYFENSRSLEVNTYTSKSRIKRDLIFSIDYLIGRYNQLPIPF